MFIKFHTDINYNILYVIIIYNNNIYNLIIHSILFFHNTYAVKCKLTKYPTVSVELFPKNILKYNMLNGSLFPLASNPYSPGVIANSFAIFTYFL